jgi:hypothetical protein
MVDGQALIEFFNSTTLEIFNRGSGPTFCTSVRQEVTDITLGSYRFLNSINVLEVSLELSLSDRRYSVHFTELLTSTPNQGP